MPPVCLAGLAARPPGMRAGPVLGERRGLPLARPPQLLHLHGQLPDADLELLVVRSQPLDLTSELVTFGPHRLAGGCLAVGLGSHDPSVQPARRLALSASPPTLHRFHRGANHTP